MTRKMVVSNNYTFTAHGTERTLVSDEHADRIVTKEHILKLHEHYVELIKHIRNLLRASELLEFRHSEQAGKAEFEKLIIVHNACDYQTATQFGKHLCRCTVDISGIITGSAEGFGYMLACSFCGCLVLTTHHMIYEKTVCLICRHAARGCVRLFEIPEPLKLLHLTSQCRGAQRKTSRFFE